MYHRVYGFLVIRMTDMHSSSTWFVLEIFLPYLLEKGLCCLLPIRLLLFVFFYTLLYMQSVIFFRVQGQYQLQKE